MATSTSNSCSGNYGLTHTCNQFIRRADELTKAFNKRKLTTCCFAEDCGYVSQHFKSCLKLLDEIRVWPPSDNLLLPELTLVCNYLLVDIAEKNQLVVKSALVSSQMDYVVCHTLRRVLQFAFKTPIAPDTSFEKNPDIETVVRKILKAVEDPIARFRLLDFLGRIVLICSIFCIYKWQRGESNVTKILLVVLGQLITTIGQSILQAVLPCQQGLMLCSPVSSEDHVDNTSLCVGDVARLVMLSCQVTAGNGSLRHKKMQWLDTFLLCKEFIKEKQYIIAMKKLETELTQPLDPEQKSLLLSQFAECYLQQGCPQLALQTYKDALQIYKDHHSIYLHLANVYKTMGLQESELESLNLLVKVLTDKCKENKQQPFTTEIDAVIMSVFQVMPNVSLPCALHLLARCYVQVHRYKEAADHYKKLLHLFENKEHITSGMTSDGPLLNTDIRELVVETVETMALAHQNVECLLVCDEFYPILSTDDITSHLSPQSPLDISANNSKDIFNNSQHNLFSQSQHSESHEIIICSPEQQEPCLPSSSAKMEYSDKFENRECESGSLTKSCLTNICSLSRKRMRSASVSQYTSPHLCLNEKDIWWYKSLLVRLLLAKTDALVTTQGFTDEILSCLTKAFNLLMDSRISIFVPNNFVDSTNQPPSKKCRLEDIEDPSSKQPEIVTTQEKSKSEESCDLQVSETWMKSVLNVAMRMAKASFEKSQMSSVLNSCHLILQLEPHNIFAHYLKTVVLKDQSHQKIRILKHWLQERGINCTSSVITLQSIMKEKETDIRLTQDKQPTACEAWWQMKELDLMSLDVTCLNTIIESMLTESKTS